MSSGRDGWRGNIYRRVERDHPWATDFWDSLAASGYRHDEQVRRSVKTL
jgi:hypothetical protein